MRNERPWFNGCFVDVVDSARLEIDVQKLCCQDDVKSVHAIQKCLLPKAKYKSAWEPLKLRWSTGCKKIRIIYEAGNYALITPYQKFNAHDFVWDSWNKNRRPDIYFTEIRRAEYILNIGDNFKKPKNTGRRLLSMSV